jgi:exosome complex exonuclease RRP6
MKKDFVIDAIILREHLYLLNELFANPNMVKIFHGCDSDVLWLQRDFGVYLVNVIDTYQIALKYRKNNSLGNMLK